MTTKLVFGQKEVQDEVTITSPAEKVITLEFRYMDIVVDIDGAREMDELFSALLDAYGMYNVDVEMAKEAIIVLSRQK